MNLIRKIPKQAKRTGRWKSQKHRTHVRGHACVKCDSTAAIEVAHVRLGSDGGMGRKPSDYYTVSLCKPCHTQQHETGEATFWKGYNLDAILGAFTKSSPARRDIEKHQRERENAP